ncbi:MAG: glycosyltransferase family 10 [Lachnospiraceae bacterium]|nr:glycosyltransferase family 10 [Lachnospiraceae bacterium]
MKIINLKFMDFWSGFDTHNNFITDIIKQKYFLNFTDNPNFIIYSAFGNEHLKYINCVKIFFTGENIVPNFNECDYAIGMHHISFEDRYVRLIGHEYLDRIENYTRESLNLNKLFDRKFCSFVYHNETDGTGSKYRKDFCEKLMEYQKIDCPGKVLHNIDTKELSAHVSNDSANSKEKFISNYKFNIAMENTVCSGYTTEKLFQAFFSGTIPIYHGNPNIEVDFNSKAFINCHNYKSKQDIIDKIIEIDNNEEIYKQMLMENPFKEHLKYKMKKDVYSFFDFIFEKGNVKLFEKRIWNITETQKEIKFKRYYRILNQILILKKDNLNLADKIKNKGYKNILIYGVGVIGKRIIDEIYESEIKIIYAIDKKEAGYYRGIQIKNQIEYCEEIDVIISSIELNKELEIICKDYQLIDIEEIIYD